MKPLIFVYAHDNMLQYVKQEASQLAIRKRDGEGFASDKEGNTYFDLFVFDEAYTVKFRELFFDARAEIVHLLSAHLKKVPALARAIDEEDYDRTVNFRLILGMEDEWNCHLSKPLDSKIREFIIACIMYRWLETKLPEDAATYLMRADRLKQMIKDMSNTMLKPSRIDHRFW